MLPTVPKINVRVEIPMPPYAGGTWDVDVSRVEAEDDGSYTAVLVNPDLGRSSAINEKLKESLKAAQQRIVQLERGYDILKAKLSKERK